MGPEEILRVIRNSSYTSALNDSFFSIEVELSSFGVLCSHFIRRIADSVPFGEGLSVNITNMKHYLFIAIIIAETKRFYDHSVSTHRIRVYRKRYK